MGQKQLVTSRNQNHCDFVLPDTVLQAANEGLSEIIVVFLLLPSQACQVGLNFASEEEAKRFRVSINDLLNRRQRKTGEFYLLSL